MTSKSRLYIRLALILTIACSIINQPASAQTPPPDPFSIFLPVAFHDYDPTWQWEQPQLVTLTPTPLGDPFLTIDLQGRQHIFWNPWSGSNTFIYHLYQTETGWTPAEAVAQTLGTSTVITSPVTGPDGTIHLIWKNALNFGGPYRLMYASWQNGVWSAEVELHRTVNNGIGGQVEIDGNGIPHVLIESVDNIITTTFYHCIPSTTGCAEKTTLPAKQFTHDMFLDRFGGVVILGDASTLFTQNLYYSYWLNGSLLQDSVSIGGKINYRPGILDADRNIIFVRNVSVPIPGGNVSGLYTQCLTSGRTWKNETVLTGSTAVGEFRFSHSPSHQVVSAWDGSSDDQLHIARWSNCVPEASKAIAAPIVGNKNWGGISALALSDQPKKICLLGSVPFYSSDFISTCVGLLR